MQTVLAFGWYNCMDDTKSAVNACIWLYCSRAKIKALHRVDARQKKSPASVGGVENFISAIQLNALCASILPAYNLR